MVGGGVSIPFGEDAEAALAVAELDLEAASKNLNACTIRAPYQGHLENLLINQYEFVQAGQAIAEVVQDRVLLAKLLVPSVYFNRVKLGQTLELSIKEIDANVPAIITHIGAVIDPASSMIKIFAEVDNRDNNLRVGMTGKTRLK